MSQYPPINVRLAVNRVDFNLITNEGVQPRLYTPGEEISSQPDFLRGHGTYVDEEKTLRASVAGVLEKVNKLISIRPLKARYNGEIGDLIVGRITEVQQKRWKVDVNSKLDAVLLLSSVNLPGGELRRRSAEDEQTMRRYLQEGDLVCAEVQSIFADSSLSLHTRVLKYGKLSQGIMLKVPPMLIQRKKTHYHNLDNGATLILGYNGYVWIGANIQNVDKSEGGFTEDLSRIPLENRESLVTSSRQMVELRDMDACFNAFDKDGDGFLSITEFDLICRALFRNDRGKIYGLEEDQLREVYSIFDFKGDGMIDKEEFEVCWNRWIKVCTRPKSAFLIVDVQNDFITGSLNIKQCAAQHDGSEVIEPINRLLETIPFDSVFYSLDWHPIDHVSFIDNLHLREVDISSNISKEAARVYDTVTFQGPPLLKQRLWPRHCVQDSWGAELHKGLKIVDNAIKIYKGTNPEVDSYSVFWDNKKLTETTLSSQLQEKGATDIYICGLAYDVCVGATAVDALTSGYRTILIDDCSRGVDLVDIEKTKATVIASNGVIVNSSQVKAMVEGRDRRPELGYKLALEIKHKLRFDDE
ncbi:pyrazinamidase nicotinamidase [Lasius niger]|uniref:nicotinamidase n=1 Tax=Lasius niger TaxID=67767 RepID=A0A0J7KZ02_LASNI|nr:pyrazinamidase nicotinamidase [Lasius niger]